MDEAEALLRANTTDVLLRTFASLTHQIHASDNPDRVESLRAQRDRVKNEILRRTGDLP